MKNRLGLWFFKLIGIGLFVVILSQIDRQEVLQQLQSINIALAIGAFPLLYAMYYCKAHRLRTLVGTSDVSLSISEGWKIYNIGIFLANITPGKVGEFGKAGYLKAMGMQTALSITITILDRLFDVLCIAMIALIGLGVLVSWKIALAITIVGLIGISIAKLLWNWTTATKWFSFLKEALKKESILPASFWTLLSWIIYFLWTIALATAIGITIPVHALIFIMTFTGVIALLPIAPLGLGTRDAALVFFLFPYGVSSEQSVSLALLMFVHILLSGALGGIYFAIGFNERGEKDKTTLIDRP